MSAPSRADAHFVILDKSALVLLFAAPARTHARPISASLRMGKDRRKEKAEESESLGKKADKFGKKGDGKIAQNQGPDKSFTHQTCRHILVQKQSDALRISEEIHTGKISFNEERPPPRAERSLRFPRSVAAPARA